MKIPRRDFLTTATICGLSGCASWEENTNRSESQEEPMPNKPSQYFNSDGELTSPVNSKSVRTETHPVRDVTAWGAKGDGKADDTNAINSAIESGASIYFPPTSDYYRITDHIAIENVSGVDVYGHGAASLIVQESDGPSGIYANDGSNISIDNITLVGNGVKNSTDEPTGIDLRSSSNITVSRCGLHDWGYDGIWAFGCHNLAWSQNIATGNYDDGFNPGGGGGETTNMMIQGNIAKNNESDGFHLSRYTFDVTCIGNGSFNNGGYGINSLGTGTPESERHTIIGNTCSGNSDWGIYLNGISKGACIGNTSEGRIYGYNSRGWVMAGNVQTSAENDLGFAGSRSNDNVVALNVSNQGIRTNGRNTQSGLNVTDAAF